MCVINVNNSECMLDKLIHNMLCHEQFVICDSEIALTYEKTNFDDKCLIRKIVCFANTASRFGFKIKVCLFFEKKENYDLYYSKVPTDEQYLLSCFKDLFVVPVLFLAC